MKYALSTLVLMAAAGFNSGALAQAPDCKDLKAYPSVVVLADSETMFYYCKDKTATPQTSEDLTSDPADIPIPLKNTSSLTVIVKGVNPTRDTFTVSFDDTPFTEIDGSVLGKFVGAPSLTATAAAPATAPDTSKSESEARTQLNSAIEAMSKTTANLNDQADIANRSNGLTGKNAYRVQTAVNGEVILEQNGKVAANPPSSLEEASKQVDTAAAAKAKAAAALQCAQTISAPQGVFSKIGDLQTEATKVAGIVASYTSDVNAAQAAYNEALGTLRGLNPDQHISNPPDQAKFQTQVNTLLAGDADHKKASSLTSVPTLKPEDVSDPALSALRPQVGASLNQVIGNISSQAVRLHSSLQSSVTADCRSTLQGTISEGQAFLESLFDSTGSKTSVADQWTAQLTAAKTLAGNVVTEESTLLGIVNDPNNFEIDARIPPEYRIQTAVKVTVSWADKLASAQIAATQPTATPASKPAKGTAKPATTPSTTPSTTNSTNSLTFTVNFGQGPRIFESAGIVFSPLAQHTFASAPVTANPGGFCTPASGAALGCIVDNGGSGWRVLPVAIGSVRWFDVNSTHFDMRQLAPNYLSFGATVKSSSTSGTSLEYLAGPSWALAGQSLFLTGGAYAGQVTGLAGGLKLGPQTTAPPTTLPTSTSYKWGFGFSITYKIASQGSTAGKVTNSSKSTAKGAAAQ